MFGRLFQKLFGADAAIDAILGRGPQRITQDEHNRVYQAGCDHITPYIQLHDNSPKSARSAKGSAEVQRGIQLLTFITQANPENWSAYWIIGKAQQALGATEQAYEAFRASFEIQDENADVAREFMFECLNLGRGKEGVAVALHAVDLEPRNAGLVANLALAHLINADLDAAEDAVNQSLAIDSKDKITNDLAKLIQDVKAGRVAQPNRMSDLP
ncbi:MAG: hypothetical protein AAF483_19230 [Planctomycetota bacterium]